MTSKQALAWWAKIKFELVYKITATIVDCLVVNSMVVNY